METVLELEPRGIVINPRIIRGTSWQLRLQLLSADSVAVDLTGGTSKLTICNSSGEVLQVLDETDGVTIGNATGFLDALVNATQSADLPAQKLNFNWDYTAADGVTVTPVARGVMTMLNNQNLNTETPTV